MGTRKTHPEGAWWRAGRRTGDGMGSRSSSQRASAPGPGLAASRPEGQEEEGPDPRSQTTSNLKMNTRALSWSLSNIHRAARGVSHLRVFWPRTNKATLPSGSGSHAVSKSPLGGLFRAVLLALLCFLLETLLCERAPLYPAVLADRPELRRLGLEEETRVR